jgi:4'-phosphopantetheinyl transferase
MSGATTHWITAPGFIGPGDGAAPVVTADGIHVWRMRFPSPPIPDDAVADARAMLSDEERARADRFLAAGHRVEFAWGRARVRRILGAYLDIAPQSLAFETSGAGKPSLTGVYAQSGLTFNVSHTGRWLVCAVARERRLGIDIEKIRSPYPADQMAGRFFCDMETELLWALPEEQRIRGFFNGWTRKEAYVKARGAGLQIGLDTFAVSLAPGLPAAFLAGVDAAWQITAFDVDGETPGALVYNAGAADVSFFDVADHVRSA